MPKINLISRAAQKQVNKRLATKNSVWIIAKEQNHKEYYVSKVDDDVAAIIWIDNQNKALKFHTEQGCQHFAQQYMKTRTDVHLRLIEDNEPC